METYNQKKASLQSLLLKKSSQSRSMDHKDCEDTDTICNMGSENRFLKRSTLYGRTSQIRNPASNNYAEIESTQPLQTSKTLRQSLYRRKQELQEHPSQSDDYCSQQDGKKEASDKQWHVTSWLQKMRPSLYKRKEQTTSNKDTARLMASNQSLLTGDDLSPNDWSENKSAVAQASALSYQRINAMYWSAKINDELTTQLLNSQSSATTDHENR